MAYEQRFIALPLVGSIEQSIGDQVLSLPNFLTCENFVFKNQTTISLRPDEEKITDFYGDRPNQLIRYKNQLLLIAKNGVFSFDNSEKSFLRIFDKENLNINIDLISQKELDILYPSISILDDTAFIFYYSDRQVLLKQYDLDEQRVSEAESILDIVPGVTNLSSEIYDGILYYAYSVENTIFVKSYDLATRITESVTNYSAIADVINLVLDGKFLYYTVEDDNEINVVNGENYIPGDTEQPVVSSFSFRNNFISVPSMINDDGTEAQGSNQLYDFRIWAEFSLEDKNYQILWTPETGMYIKNNEGVVLAKFNSNFVPLVLDNNMKYLEKPIERNGVIYVPILQAGQDEFENQVVKRPLNIALLSINLSNEKVSTGFLNDQMIIGGELLTYYDGERLVENGFTERPVVEVVSNPNEFERQIINIPITTDRERVAEREAEYIQAKNENFLHTTQSFTIVPRSSLEFSLFIQTDTEPATPTATYDDTNGVLENITQGWSATFPTDDGDDTTSIYKVFVNVNPDDITDLTFSDPFVVTLEGENNGTSVENQIGVRQGFFGSFTDTPSYLDALGESVSTLTINSIYFEANQGAMVIETQGEGNIGSFAIDRIVYFVHHKVGNRFLAYTTLNPFEDGRESEIEILPTIEYRSTGNTITNINEGVVANSLKYIETGRYQNNFQTNVGLSETITLDRVDDLDNGLVRFGALTTTVQIDETLFGPGINPNNLFAVSTVRNDQETIDDREYNSATSTGSITTPLPLSDGLISSIDRVLLHKEDFTVQEIGDPTTIPGQEFLEINLRGKSFSQTSPGNYRFLTNIPRNSLSFVNGLPDNPYFSSLDEFAALGNYRRDIPEPEEAPLERLQFEGSFSESERVEHDDRGEIYEYDFPLSNLSSNSIFTGDGEFYISTVLNEREEPRFCDGVTLVLRTKSNVSRVTVRDILENLTYPLVINLGNTEFTLFSRKPDTRNLTRVTLSGSNPHGADVEIDFSESKREFSININVPRSVDSAREVERAYRSSNNLISILNREFFDGDLDNIPYDPDDRDDTRISIRGDISIRAPEIDQQPVNNVSDLEVDDFVNSNLSITFATKSAYRNFSTFARDINGSSNAISTTLNLLSKPGNIEFNLPAVISSSVGGAFVTFRLVPSQISSASRNRIQHDFIQALNSQSSVVIRPQGNSVREILPSRTSSTRPGDVNNINNYLDDNLDIRIEATLGSSYNNFSDFITSNGYEGQTMEVFLNEQNLLGLSGYANHSVSGNKLTLRWTVPGRELARSSSLRNIMNNVFQAGTNYRIDIRFNTQTVFGLESSVTRTETRTFGSDLSDIFLPVTYRESTTQLPIALDDSNRINFELDSFIIDTFERRGTSKVEVVEINFKATKSASGSDQELLEATANAFKDSLSKIRFEYGFESSIRLFELIVTAADGSVDNFDSVYSASVDGDQILVKLRWQSQNRNGTDSLSHIGFNGGPVELSFFSEQFRSRTFNRLLSIIQLELGGENITNDDFDSRIVISRGVENFPIILDDFDRTPSVSFWRRNINAYPFIQSTNANLVFKYFVIETIEEETGQTQTIDNLEEQRAYIYSAVFKWIDARGFEHRSVQSLQKDVLTTLDIGVDNPIGLNLKCLNLTTKNGVQIELYRTQNKTTVLRKVADLVNRKDLAFLSYDDVTPDALLGEPLLADSFHPDGGNIIEVFNDRFFISGFQNFKNRIQYSDPLNLGGNSAVNFVEGNSLLAEEEVVALRKMDNRLYIFTTDQIYTWAEAATILAPQAIEGSRNISPVNPNSIQSTPMGLMFQSAGGYFMLGRGIDLQFKGIKVQNIDDATCVSSVINKDNKEVIFFNDNNESLVYNYQYDKWSSLAGSANSSVIYNEDILTLNNVTEDLREPAKSGGSLNKFQTLYTPGSKTSCVEGTFETGWIQLSQIQGYQKVKSFKIIGKFKDLEHMTVYVYYNFEDTVKFTLRATDKNFPNPNNFPTRGDKIVRYGDESSTYGGASFDDIKELRFMLPLQKCNSIKLKISPKASFTELSSIGFQLRVLPDSGRLRSRQQFSKG